MKETIGMIIAIIGLLAVIAGLMYLQSWLIVWAFGLFAVKLSMMQGFGIVVVLSLIGSFFKSTNK